MDEIERDKISKGFADLTAMLGDAAGFAVNRQASQLSLPSLREDIAHIWSLLFASVAKLASIERGVGTQGANRDP